MNYIELLRNQGDRFEIQAFKFLDLENTFPRYAEIWSPYVYPYRLPDDRSKLHNKYPKILERIANTHYWILYRLLKARKQNLAIEYQIADIIEFEDPLFQMSSVMDLVLDIFTLVVKGVDTDLEKIETDLSDNNVKLEVFKSLVPKPHLRSLQELEREINTYRNLMIHGIAPIRKYDSSHTVLIPKIDVLRDSQYWTHNTLRDEDFIVAYEKLNEYLFTLLEKINELWGILLPNVQHLVEQLPMPLPNEEFNKTDVVKPDVWKSTNSGGSATIHIPPSAYTGGSADYVPPSAYKNDESNDPF